MERVFSESPQANNDRERGRRYQSLKLINQSVSSTTGGGRRYEILKLFFQSDSTTTEGVTGFKAFGRDTVHLRVLLVVSIISFTIFKALGRVAVH